MTVDYLVKASESPRGVRIYADGTEVGEIRTRDDLSYALTTTGGDEWTLNTRVHGEISPFSMTVKKLKAHDAADATPERTVLTVRNNVFLHDGKFYVMGGAPEGRPLREFLVGKKYICRLDNFPFSDLTAIDQETMGRLRRFRGAPVGEMEGLGKMGGHRLHLLDELEDISLPLAASCYLLYSTA